MSQAGTIGTRWTEAEFFTWQARQPDRYELVNGFPLRMMSGARRAHDRIVRNVITALHRRLQDHPWETFTADFAVRTGPDQIRRPDAGVDCAPGEGEELVANDPKLVIEVLFPITSRFDLYDKLDEYRAMNGLTDIVLIATDAIAVRHHHRDDAGGWVRRDLASLDGTIGLPTLGIELPLCDIYGGTSAARNAPPD